MKKQLTALLLCSFALSALFFVLPALGVTKQACPLSSTVHTAPDCMVSMSAAEHSAHHYAALGLYALALLPVLVLGLGVIGLFYRRFQNTEQNRNTLFAPYRLETVAAFFYTTLLLFWCALHNKRGIAHAPVFVRVYST